MRIGPDTGIKSTQTYEKWKGVMKGEGGNLIKCEFCKGMGYRRSRLEKKKPEECPKCKGWGFTKSV